MTAMARPALLYFLLWLGVTLSTAMDLEKRIVGGKTCGNNQHQHYVMLIVGRALCGGSLIRDRWVLTAAHCVNPGETITAYVNVHPGHEEEEMCIAPTDIHKEEHGHDIMLLKLPRKPKTIHKIDLPDAADCRNDLKLNNMVQFAGRGGNAVDSTGHLLNEYPPSLHCARMTVVDCQLLKEALEEEFPDIPYGNYFCAQDKGKDIGNGDSGGGVVYNGKIYGVIKGAHPTQAFVIPCFSLRVCKYRTWIESTIAKNS